MRRAVSRSPASFFARPSARSDEGARSNDEFDGAGVEPDDAEGIVGDDGAVLGGALEVGAGLPSAVAPELLPGVDPDPVSPGVLLTKTSFFGLPDCGGDVAGDGAVRLATSAVVGPLASTRGDAEST